MTRGDVARNFKTTTIMENQLDLYILMHDDGNPKEINAVKSIAKIKLAGASGDYVRIGGDCNKILSVLRALDEAKGQSATIKEADTRFYLGDLIDRYEQLADIELLETALKSGTPIGLSTNSHYTIIKYKLDGENIYFYLKHAKNKSCDSLAKIGLHGYESICAISQDKYNSNECWDFGEDSDTDNWV